MQTAGLSPAASERAAVLLSFLSVLPGSVAPPHLYYQHHEILLKDRREMHSFIGLLLFLSLIPPRITPTKKKKRPHMY